ncbi:carbohydrate kinase [Gemmatimonadota bacterium]
MEKTIVSFGEILWDILPTGKVIGGAPFNFAYRVNSLGNRGLIMSRLGRDELGYNAFDTVLALGLETTYLQWDDSFPTGTVQVSFDEHNNPDYLIVPQVAYDHIQATEKFLDIIPAVDCFCFGTLSQRSEQTRQALEQLLERTRNSLKLCDINLRKKCYDKKTIVFSLEQADIVKMNENEALELAGLLGIPDQSLKHICKKLESEFSLSYCTVTLAENGAYSLSDKGESVYVPGYRIEAIDSLGTGDAFAAGFVHQILHGNSLAEACELGNKLATLVAAKRGATATVTLEEIRCFQVEGVGRNIHPQFV